MMCLPGSHCHLAGAAAIHMGQENVMGRLGLGSGFRVNIGALIITNTILGGLLIIIVVYYTPQSSFLLLRPLH